LSEPLDAAGGAIFGVVVVVYGDVNVLFWCRRCAMVRKKKSAAEGYYKHFRGIAVRLHLIDTITW
jgi:hypothetical protein